MVQYVMWCSSEVLFSKMKTSQRPDGFFYYYTLIKKTIEFNRVSYRAVNLWVDSESIRFTIHKFLIQEWFLQIQNDSIHNKIWFD